MGAGGGGGARPGAAAAEAPTGAGGENATAAAAGGGGGPGARAVTAAPAPAAAAPTPPAVDPRDYYRTYDAMTGVRIAATLGGFFGLMVLLVLYKSKSKTEKALEDPNFTAAAVAEVEEEERQLQLALEMTAYHQLNPRRSSRRSLDTSAYGSGGTCASAAWGRRFSSVAGRYPPTGGPPLRASLAAAALPRRVDEEDATDDGGEEDADDDDDGACSLYGDVYGYASGQLSVPRRSSNITCSSSGSSYLERRDSAVVLSAAPIAVSAPHKYGRSSGRRLSSPPAAATFVDWYYPIDIRVTQPTPGGSPSGSDRALHDRALAAIGGSHSRVAPLASISSCNSSLGTDYPECSEMGGAPGASSSGTLGGVDSTDDEVDPFSTDSGSEGGASASACACRRMAESRVSLRITSPPRHNEVESVSEATARLQPGSSQPSNSTSTLVEASAEVPHFTMTENVRRYSSPSVVRLCDRPFAQETLF